MAGENAVITKTKELARSASHKAIEAKDFVVDKVKGLSGNKAQADKDKDNVQAASCAAKDKADRMAQKAHVAEDA